jgi:hypothetical protein
LRARYGSNATDPSRARAHAIGLDEPNHSAACDTARPAGAAQQTCPGTPLGIEPAEVAATPALSEAKGVAGAARSSDSPVAERTRAFETNHDGRDAADTTRPSAAPRSDSRRQIVSRPRGRVVPADRRSRWTSWFGRFDCHRRRDATAIPSSQGDDVPTRGIWCLCSVGRRLSSPLANTCPARFADRRRPFRPHVAMPSNKPGGIIYRPFRLPPEQGST